VQAKDPEVVVAFTWMRRASELLAGRTGVAAIAGWVMTSISCGGNPAQGLETRPDPNETADAAGRDLGPSGSSAADGGDPKGQTHLEGGGADDANAADRQLGERAILEEAEVSSRYCGDGIRDPRTEECDDGANGSHDSCSEDCRVRIFPVLASGVANGQSVRSLGAGPHVASASASGFAVVYNESTVGSANGGVLLQAFGKNGARAGALVDVGQGSSPTTWTSPVVAALPDGQYAVAWTDQEQGVPGVRIRLVDAASGTLGEARGAAEPPAQDADVLWTGSELVIAWTDLVDAKYRAFDARLAPLGPAGYLAASPSLESGVALAPFAGSWAAALYENDEGHSAIEVKAGTLSWSTPPELPPPVDARPALVELDSSHLLLVFTVGTNPDDSGSASAARLRAAVLSIASPGPVESFELTPRLTASAMDAMLSLARPSAARVGDRVYLAWESWRDAVDTTHREAFLAEIELDPTDATKIVQHVETPLPRGAQSTGRIGPRLAAAPLFPQGALISLWEDRTQPSGPLDPSRLMLDFRPSPFVFLAGD
jgi:cysteine-rich repeat protein